MPGDKSSQFFGPGQRWNNDIRFPTEAEQRKREEARKLEGNCPECSKPLVGEIEEYDGQMHHRDCAWSAGNHDSFPTEEYDGQGERL